MARTRLSAFHYPGGGTATRQIPPNSPLTSFDNSSSFYSSYHNCVDENHSPGIDHALSIDHYTRHLNPLNGIDYGVGGEYAQYANFYPQNMLLYPSHLSFSLPTEAASATTTLARTNPNRADVQTLVFLYELKDLPGMIREIGDYKLKIKNFGKSEHGTSKSLANFHLSLVMGWSPLISDIRKLLTFQSHVDRRIKELKSLQSNGGLHRSIKHGLGEANVFQSSIVSIETSLGRTIRSRKDVMTTARRWATVRWTPTSVPSDRYTSRELNQLARSLVYGTHLGLKDVWDALPWTWLVDWFTNVGDYLEANRNTVPVVASQVNVMTQTTTTVSWSRVDAYKAFAGGDGTDEYTTKRRTLQSGAIQSNFQFLTERQLSILSSLAVQRLRR